ncbi:hypothetical protein H072_8320 [Dactylellina haptotyla CBS 200.50]|uniref:Erythromycin biosynthesis protein CIII-like C-terminal domain-containing protein n=1 Tax=Dactylellina haptotyla (strain CBS 200.50) TaxID=1284197 RepID=S8A5B0_DACHA|nr:hypothetical protein H072_8320 [Dactylellina haptotyla CBS 200.50]
MADIKPIIVITAAPIMAHFKSLLPISTYLVKQGYEVHITTGAGLREDSEWTGATFHPYPEDISDPTKLIQEVEGIEKGTPQRVNMDLIQFFITPIPKQYETIQNVCESITTRESYQREPIIIMNETGSWAVAPYLFGAPWRGVPPSAVITVGSVPVSCTDPDLAPFNAGLPPAVNDEERAKYTAMHQQIWGTEDFFAGAQAFYESTLRGLGATKDIPVLLDHVKLSDRYLQCSLEEQEYKRAAPPKGLRYIGWPELKGRKVPPFPPFWDEILEVSKQKSKKIVFACQGTVPWNDMNDLIVPTLKGLDGRDDLLVIASLGAPHQKLPDGFEIPANARVCHYIPFEDLFPHIDIFVNSGGFGSTQQALYYGAPIILVGVGEDKPENNARVEWTGAAINLKCQTAKPEDVREAVLKMVEDDKYSKRAKYFSEQYHSVNPLELVEQNIKEVMKEKL